MISEKYLERYKKLYRDKTGKDISDQEALEQATKLVTLVKAVYQPITVDEYKALQKRRLETGDITEKELEELVKNIKYTTKKPRK